MTLSGPGGETNVVADRIQQIGGDSDLFLATGNVEIIRGNNRLVADRVELNRATGEAVAQGRAVFFDGQDRLVGERIDFNIKTGTGIVHKGSTFVPPYYHLSADRMDKLGRASTASARASSPPARGTTPRGPSRWARRRPTSSPSFRAPTPRSSSRASPSFPTCPSSRRRSGVSGSRASSSPNLAPTRATATSPASRITGRSTTARI